MNQWHHWRRKFIFVQHKVQRCAAKTTPHSCICPLQYFTCGSSYRPITIFVRFGIICCHHCWWWRWWWGWRGCSVTLVILLQCTCQSSAQILIATLTFVLVTLTSTKHFCQWVHIHERRGRLARVWWMYRWRLQRVCWGWWWKRLLTVRKWHIAWALLHLQMSFTLYGFTTRITTTIIMINICSR